MSDIAHIDKNFEIKTKLEKEDIKLYHAAEPPFHIYGIYREGGRYRRMPESVAKSISEGVYAFHDATAGGRLRFVTDSSYVAIFAKMDKVIQISHGAFTGCAGFDLYVGKDYVKTFIPPRTMTDGYESIVEFPTNELREITINFPRSSAVKDLHIGLQESATVKEASSYQNEKPIVYYGSSVTQGGCASRPGMEYQNVISRRFHYDYINLGFSGSARAEDGIIDYIKKLDMSIFVYDYDYNAPTPEYLEKTHEKMFKAIRKENPYLPIILMSRPKYTLNAEDEQCLHIVETTYHNALSAGDKNVYFIDGPTLMQLCKNDGTVDGIHPSDFGFASMAKAVGDVIENIVI